MLIANIPCVCGQLNRTLIDTKVLPKGTWHLGDTVPNLGSQIFEGVTDPCVQCGQYTDVFITLRKGKIHNVRRAPLPVLMRDIIDVTPDHTQVTIIEGLRCNLPDTAQ